MYIPSNTIFTVAGSFNKKEILDIFKANLKQNTNCQKSFDVAINKQKIVKHIPYPQGKKTEIMVIFYSKLYYWSPQFIYFPLIESILVDGLESILMHHLRTKLDLIYNISVDIDTDITGTIVSISVSTADKKVKKVIGELLFKLKQFTEQKFSSKLLNGTKNKYLIRRENTCKNVRFLSDFYGEQYANQITRVNKKIYSYDDIYNKIKDVTKAKISEIAKKLFNFKTFKIAYIGRRKLHGKF